MEEKKKRRSFHWDWIYMPLLVIFLFWSVVQLAYGGEKSTTDIIQSLLNAIGLSQESVTLVMLLIVAVIVVVCVLTKYGKISKFLEKNVGTAETEQGSANAGIKTIIDRTAPLTKIATIEENAKTAASDISAAKNTLNDLDKSVAVLKKQADIIAQIQISNPDTTLAIQNAQAATLNLMNELLQERRKSGDLQRENDLLRQEKQQLLEKIDQLQAENKGLKKKRDRPLQL